MLEAFLHKLEVCGLLSNKEVTWVKLRLKSLRPKPHWKPTNDQVAALQYALGEGGKFNKEALQSLHDQLEELILAE